MSEHIYNVSLEWVSDRKGVMQSPELNDKIEVVTPPPFPKGIEGIWSPEHLYTASILSCFMTTFLAVAENSKLEFTKFSCKAQGKLGMVENIYMMTDVWLKPVLEIAHEKDVERAGRILQKSEVACLISNSAKSTIHFEPTVFIK
ncbi:MAG: OsmC family protein [Sphingobacteriales bacterium]|jgi:organic hydroperoxide reductase OsmC/OhrA|nr:OsmC family protein [Sphingobacteriales bacterium]